MSSNRKPKQSIFERARNAKPRTEHYDIPLVERDEALALSKRLASAKRAASAVSALTNADMRAEVEQELKDAQAAFDESFDRVVFKGLPPEDYEALTNEHPGDDWVYHLAAASCTTPGAPTAEQWRELVEKVWPNPDGIALKNAVLGANIRPFSEGIPKD